MVMLNSEQKVALITGANKGIGYEIARQLGKTGITVLLGTRDAKRGEEAATQLKAEGIDAKVIAVDVTQNDTVVAAAKQIETDYGKLDILVNNAGIAVEDRSNLMPSAQTVEQLKQTFDTNFFGPFFITKTFIPLLKLSKAGRIVNISSTLGSLAQQRDYEWQFAQFKLPGYCASKAALNMLTIQFGYELKDSAIKINSADPGFTATDFNGHTGIKTAEEGARVAVHLATLPEDGPTGLFFDDQGQVAW